MDDDRTATGRQLADALLVPGGWRICNKQEVFNVSERSVGRVIREYRNDRMLISRTT